MIALNSKLRFWSPIAELDPVFLTPILSCFLSFIPTDSSDPFYTLGRAMSWLTDEQLIYTEMQTRKAH